MKTKTPQLPTFGESPSVQESPSSSNYHSDDGDTNQLIEINDKQIQACAKNIRVLNKEMDKLWEFRIKLLQRRKTEKND